MHLLIKTGFGPHIIKTLEVRLGKRFPVKEKTPELPQEKLALKVFNLVLALIFVIPATIIGTVYRYSSRTKDPLVTKLVQDWLKHQRIPIDSVGWSLDQTNQQPRASLDQTSHITKLPVDIFLHILNFACPQPKDIAPVSLVNKRWRTAADRPEVWKGIAQRFPDVDLKSDVHCKKQIQALFKNAEEVGYPDEVLKLFGGFEKFLQIPTIEVPNDLNPNDYNNNFDKKILGDHQIAKFTGEAGRHMIGLRYIRNIPSSGLQFNNHIIPGGLYKEALVLFPLSTNHSLTWTFQDTFRSPSLLLGAQWLGAQWLDHPRMIQWLEKLLSGVPCGLLRYTSSLGNCIEINEGPILNEDGKPSIQLWTPEL